MSVHVDPARLTTFATTIDDVSPALGRLDRHIDQLRTSAEALMDGVASPSAGDPHTSTAPQRVADRLPDVAAEIRRRLQLLERLKESGLADMMGLDPATVAFRATQVDRQQVKDTVTGIAELLERDDFGANGNRDDITAALAPLDDLSAAELDAVVDGLSDTELAELNAMITDTDGSWWNPLDHNGLPRWSRLDLYSTLLSQVSPSRLDRIVGAFPGVNPRFDTTDAFLDGENAQTGENASGLHWGEPDGEVFRRGPDGEPVVTATQMEQGTFGDCWFVASVMSAQQAQPGFIPEHMRVNPNGTVSVQMYDGEGAAHWVTVTRSLPLDSGGEPAGVGSDDGLRWGSYYEKAFALAYQEDEGGAPDKHEGDPTYDRAEQGTYGATEWDFTENAAPYITGQDAEDLGHDFGAVQESFGNGQPVLVSTPGEAPDPPDDWAGYSTRHVYYVQDVTADTVILANPWGQEYGTIEVTREEFDDYFGDASTMTFEE